MSKDDGNYQLLRNAFPDIGAFRRAVEDDIDQAVNQAGWKKVTLLEMDQPYEAYFRSVLGVVRALLKAAGDNFRWWSGESGPAPSDERRETPFDGDTFKLSERDVMAIRQCHYRAASFQRHEPTLAVVRYVCPSYLCGCCCASLLSYWYSGVTACALRCKSISFSSFLCHLLFLYLPTPSPQAVPMSHSGA